MGCFLVAWGTWFMAGVSGEALTKESEKVLVWLNVNVRHIVLSRSVTLGPVLCHMLSEVRRLRSRFPRAQRSQLLGEALVVCSSTSPASWNHSKSPQAGLADSTLARLQLTEQCPLRKPSFDFLLQLT